MPYLPELAEGAQARQMVDVFGGYNHNLRIAEGEWYDEKNLSSAQYPLFSRRRPRSLYKTGLLSPQGMLAKDALAWVDGATLYYNSYPIEGIALSTDAADCPKQLVSMGAYLCVFPDAVYVNTANLSDCGNMEAHYASVTDANVTYTPCRLDGTAYEDITLSDTEPASPTNGMLWMDSSEKPDRVCADRGEGHRPEFCGLRRRDPERRDQRGRGREGADRGAEHGDGALRPRRRLHHRRGRAGRADGAAERQRPGGSKRAPDGLCVRGEQPALGLLLRHAGRQGAQ